VPIEYPKWIDGVLVRNTVEEAHRAAWAEETEAIRAAERARPPSLAGIRMRRTRERRREGKLSIRSDVSLAHIEDLAQAGFIDPALQGDAAEIARGIGRLMDQVTRSVPAITSAPGSPRLLPDQQLNQPRTAQRDENLI
jgi:hypothetical protein